MSSGIFVRQKKLTFLYRFPALPNSLILPDRNHKTSDMKKTILLLGLSAFILLFPFSCNDNKGKKECNVVVQDCPEVIKNCLTAEEEKGVRDGTMDPGTVWDAIKRRCPDAEKADNGATIYCLKTYPDALLVTGKEDMMRQLKDFTKKNDCCVKKLVISGHGRAGLVSVGDGQTTVTCKHINGTPEDMAKWKEQLKDLKDILCPGATIILDACGVADGETGLAKLQEVAKEYGVKVIGAKGTASSGKKLEDEPDDKKRTVDPPVNQVVPPNKSERDSLAGKEADIIKEKMQPNGTELRIFRQPVKAIGIYDAASENIPSVSQNPDLPIKDNGWILGLEESIDISRVYTAAIPDKYDADIIIVIQYQDSTYEYIRTILNNNLVMVYGGKGVNYLFAASERTRSLLMEGIKMSQK